VVFDVTIEDRRRHSQRLTTHGGSCGMLMDCENILPTFSNPSIFQSFWIFQFTKNLPIAQKSRNHQLFI
jgi:hypothetical protein